MSSAAGRSASWSAAVSSRSSPIVVASAAPSARSASIRSSVAAALELGEAGGGRERELLPRHVGERAAAPLPECRAEQARRLARVAPGERLASGAGLGLEGDGIDRFWRHGEPVAGRRRLNHAVRHARLPERDPQPGDEGLQRVGRVSRPLVPARTAR